MAGQPPVNVNASRKAKELLSYLNDLTVPGSNHLTGQHNWLQAPTWETSQNVLPLTGGKHPAISAYELGDIEGHTEAEIATFRDNVMTAAISHHNAGGIISFCYHQAFPLTAPTWANCRLTKTQAQFDVCVTPGTAEYNWLIAEYDKLAVFFQRLKDASVPVLFRPYHEMNGYWWWYGKKSGASFTKLWNMIYDRLAVHHGLNNIIWGWSPNCPRTADPNIGDFTLYYPGTATTAKVDVVGFDIYNSEFLQSHHDSLWTFSQANGQKPMGLFEVGGLPNMNTVQGSQYRYAFSIAWGEPEFSSQNTLANKQQYYFHAISITRDEVIIPMAITNTPPVNVNASTKTKELLSYLHDLTLPGSKHLTGQHNWLGAPTANITNLVLPISGGKYPAISSFELGEISGKSDATIYTERDAMTTAAINYHNAGGIVLMCYHQQFPLTSPDWGNVWNDTNKTGTGYKTQAEFDQVVTPGTAQYNWLLAEYDKIAIFFKRLQTANVPVLFRPYHEMNGYWFWWGRKSNASYTALWNLIYDRLVNYHGLNNILWNWCPHNSPRASDPNIADFKLFYPGASKVDVLTFDIYNNEFLQSHHDNLWAFSQANGQKPIGLSEVGGLPNQQTMQDNQYRYAFSSAWGETYFSDENTLANKQQYYAHTNAITRDEVVIPPLGTTPTDPDPDPPTAGLTELRVGGAGRNLVNSEGNPFFWLADTAWELWDRLNRTDIATYLNNCVAQGFNVVQAVGLPEKWALTNPNVNGDFPLTGNNSDTPATTPNSNPSNATEYDFWDHVDYAIDLANSLGIYIALLPTWGRYMIDNSANGQPYNPVITTNTKAYNYGLWIANRYKNRKNIVWVLGGDRAPDTEPKRELVRQMANGIRASGATQLMTLHPWGGASSSDWFHTETWLDFNMYQSGHVAVNYDNYSKITSDYAKSPIKPTIDGEPRYEEAGINFNPVNGRFSAYDVRQAAYWAVFAGAFGHTYGHYSIWQMTSAAYPDSQGISFWNSPGTLNAPGRSTMRYLRNLMESRPILGSYPDQSLVTNALSTGDHVRCRRGTNYAFIYTRQAITVNLGKITGANVKAYWYNPRTGAVTTIGTYTNSGTRVFTPTATGVNNDWVLVLDDVAAAYPEPGTTTNPNPPTNPPTDPNDTTPPTPPGNLSLVSKTHDSVTMSWTASTDISGIDVYDIYNGPNYFGYMQDFANLRYTATGLLPSTAYSFTVRSRDKAGNWSTPSNVLAVTTNASPGSGDTTPPTTPVLTLVDKTDTTVTFSWTASTDVSGIDVYDIYVDGVYANYTQDYANLTYTATGLAPLTQHSFQVKAKDWAANWSPLSTALVVTTNDVPVVEPPVEPEPEPTGEIVHWTNRDFAIPATNITYKPQFPGQLAIVNRQPFIAIGKASKNDWIQLSPLVVGELLLLAPNETIWKLTVDNAGVVGTTVYVPPVPETPTAPQAYYVDNFDRADDATTIGSGWTYPYGTWGIQSNKLYCVDDLDGNFTLYDLGAGKQNFDFSCKVSGDISDLESASIPLICIRCTDISTYLYVSLIEGGVYLGKTVEFASTDLANGLVGALVDGTEYTVRVIANGDNVKVYVNGTPYINHTLSSDDFAIFGSNTAIGFKITKWGTPTTTPKWDDLSVYEVL